MKEKNNELVLNMIRPDNITYEDKKYIKKFIIPYKPKIWSDYKYRNNLEVTFGNVDNNYISIVENFQS